MDDICNFDFFLIFLGFEASGIFRLSKRNFKLKKTKSFY